MWVQARLEEKVTVQVQTKGATDYRDSMVRTAGASSMIFWCLLWTLQSLSNRWSMLPCLSPNTWTSTCLRREREEEKFGKEERRIEWREEEAKGREKEGRGRHRQEREKVATRHKVMC